MIPFFQGAAGGAPVASQVFATTLYTGNGSAGRVVTSGINLSTPGGLAWIKGRDAAVAYDHQLFDTQRGTTAVLESNTTTAEGTLSGVTAFGTTGFTLGNEAQSNQNTGTYVAWSFARAARFFDVVTWTGDGTSSQTINHSLGVTPGLIIAKRRDSTSGWFVWHRGSDVANSWTQLSLNATLGGAQANWSSRVSSTTFATVMLQDAHLGATPNTNLATYVAYLFAHDTAGDGIVQCGSYTGNGSATGPTVTLGWNPQFVMIKRAGTTGDWVMFDTARGIAAGNDPTLCANRSAAEDGVLSAADYIDLTGTGFQLASSNATLNATGGTYVYACVRAA